jgi:N-methylhydantoinase B
MHGGAPGASGEVQVDGVPVDYRTNVVLKPGQRILLRTPGGGGVGPPSKRDPQALERDRREEYV